MAQKQVYLTPDGLTKYEAELEQLVKVRRPEVVERIQRAKEMGGTVNNAEYDDAKNEQSFVEGRILTLQNLLKNAVVIKEATAGTQGIVQVGSRVVVQTPGGECEHYSIVGSAEADPLHGRISNESPVGRALLGKHLGEEVEVTAPAGKRRLRIVEVS
ncbi:MAG: transcription elongation factor GreA [Chloroflexi bacterium]|nr:transcription elongation factor GreA [Chloroflexota bacterium]